MEALRILNDKRCGTGKSTSIICCIVHGLPEPREATLEGYLDEEQNRVYILKKAKTGARTIATHYRVLEERDGLSLLEVRAAHRPHPIRSAPTWPPSGIPLLGDGKYGTNALNRGTGFTKQALCSYKLRFDFYQPGRQPFLPPGGGNSRFPTSGSPEEFRKGAIGKG